MYPKTVALPVTHQVFKIRVEDLPSPPSVAIELLNLFNERDVLIDQIANVINVDPALSAKIIAYCNSPLLGATREIDTVERAIVTLGMHSVRMLALSFSLVETREGDGNFDYPSFWNKSLATAVSLRMARRHCCLDGDEQGFLLGLMMNIGEIAMYREQPALLKQGRFESIQSTLEFDVRHMKTDRFAVGSRILNEWNFPSAMTECVASLSAFNDESNDSAIRSIDLAWRLSAILCHNTPTGGQVDTCRTILLDLTSLNEHSLDSFFAELIDAWQQYAELLELKTDTNVTSLREIELAARMRMTEISINQIQNQQQIEQENELLRTSVTRDSLTGINNRRAYDDQAKRDLGKCARNKQPFSVLVIDIDHFKRCNDRWGHQVGDNALVHVAKTIAGTLRDYDDLYRFGGEEFVVVLPECDPADVPVVAERIRDAVENSPLQVKNNSIPLTVSVGVASTSQANRQTLEGLFEAADKCLYEAKSRGRNCCVVTDMEASLA